MRDRKEEILDLRAEGLSAGKIGRRLKIEDIEGIKRVIAAARRAGDPRAALKINLEDRRANTTFEQRVEHVLNLTAAGKTPREIAQGLKGSLSPDGVRMMIEAARAAGDPRVPPPEPPPEPLPNHEVIAGIEAVLWKEIHTEGSGRKNRITLPRLRCLEVPADV